MVSSINYLFSDIIKENPRFYTVYEFYHRITALKHNLILIILVVARYFITRALLAAENFVQAQQILRDSGCGSAEGVSINMTFLSQDGNRMFHNAEVGPAISGKESQLSILTASPGEHFFHCNK